jgi:hypothetical protein
MSAGADDEYAIYIQATFEAGLLAGLRCSTLFPPHALLAPPGCHVGVTAALTAMYPVRGSTEPTPAFGLRSEIANPACRSFCTES